MLFVSFFLFRFLFGRGGSEVQSSARNRAKTPVVSRGTLRGDASVPRTAHPPSDSDFKMPQSQAGVCLNA